MATPTQITANRTNAQHSTGPVTALGKQTSSRNATTHGLTSSQIIVPGEDPAEFDALRADILHRLAPEGDYERSLAENVAVSLWRHKRMLRYEAAFWKLTTTNQLAQHAEAGVEDADPDTMAASLFLDAGMQRQISLIHRYLTSAERAYAKALSTFEKAKAARPEPEAEPEPETAKSQRSAVPQIAQPSPQPRPASIGFDSQSSLIHTGGVGGSAPASPWSAFAGS